MNLSMKRTLSTGWKSQLEICFVSRVPFHQQSSTRIPPLFSFFFSFFLLFFPPPIKNRRFGRPTTFFSSRVALTRILNKITLHSNLQSVSRNFVFVYVRWMNDRLECIMRTNERLLCPVQCNQYALSAVVRTLPEDLWIIISLEILDH